MCLCRQGSGTNFAKLLGLLGEGKKASPLFMTGVARYDSRAGGLNYSDTRRTHEGQSLTLAGTRDFRPDSLVHSVTVDLPG